MPGAEDVSACERVSSALKAIAPLPSSTRTFAKSTGPAAAAEVLHAAEASLLELRVADREDLVDEQDLRFEMCCDGEREPHGHPARVALHGRVDELVDARELEDLGQLALDLASFHAE